MRIAGSFALLALASLPVAGAAQSSPTADAFRRNIAHAEKNLVASAEEMPADKYSYKPTPAQMSFGEIVLHVADDNDEACPAHRGAPRRQRAPSSRRPTTRTSSSRGSARVSLSASNRSPNSTIPTWAPEVAAFGAQWTRSSLMMERIEDWADHYSQFAIYLRLNNLLPPTAKS